MKRIYPHFMHLGRKLNVTFDGQLFQGMIEDEPIRLDAETKTIAEMQLRIEVAWMKPKPKPPLTKVKQNGRRCDNRARGNRGAGSAAPEAGTSQGGRLLWVDRRWASGGS